MEKSCQGHQKGIIEEGTAAVPCEAQTGVQIVDEEVHVSVKEVNGAVQTDGVKPRRGRPKKNIHEERAGNEAQRDGIKPCRGRPKKDVEVQTDGVKPRRGRPKNNIPAERAGNEGQADAGLNNSILMGKKFDDPKVPGDENANISGGDTNKLKDMIMQALDNAGGVDYLTDQALGNPNAFFGLVKSICAKSTAVADNAVKGESIVIRIRGLKAK